MAKYRVSILLAMIVVGLASSVSAQGLGERLRRRAQQAAEDKVDKVVRCALQDQACIDKAKADGKTVETVDANGKAVPAGSAPPAAPTPTGTAGASPAAAATAMKPGEGAWVNYDFVPGTRPLYVEDFARDTVGDFPKRLEFGDGNMELAEWQGARYVRVTTRPGKFNVVLPEQLPEQFTLEFDSTPSLDNNWTVLRFSDKADTDVRFRLYGGKGMGGLFGPRNQTQGTTKDEIPATAVFHARIMADGRYVKVYINDTRVANIPNADIGRSNKISFELEGSDSNPVFIGNFSVMAGGRKLYDALTEKGRVATQGIYFDTGSDRVRPESTPTLKEIAAMLTDHPELKLLIEGHTDNVGAAAANQQLSEKRATAVRQVLTTQFGVDGSRLEAKGFGDTVQSAPNTTPEGRQMNRRVELVKR